MATLSKIEWTEATWNPVTGCTKISLGCRNCYAERMARRLHAMGQDNYRNGFRPTTHNHVLDVPIMWKKPRTIFVNSMSDLFHEDVPSEFIINVFHVMRRANWHRYQVLTKRSKRLVELSAQLPWEPNIWMGVSVESRQFLYRIDHLRETPAMVKFLSLEPLLGPLPDMNLKAIDWVIVGGESGPGASPPRQEWVRDIQQQCASQDVPFFFKQWGGVNKKKNGRLLDGKIWNEMPRHEIVLATG